MNHEKELYQSPTADILTFTTDDILKSSGESDDHMAELLPDSELF